MGYGRRLVRNLWRSAVVAAVIVGIGLGLPAINGSIAATQPVATTAYRVGAGVSLMPPPGANIDTTVTRPGGEAGQVLFYVGSVRYAIVATPFDGSLTSATQRLREEIRQRSGYQIAGPESRTATSKGVPGRAGMYSSPGRDGRYTVFVSHRVAVSITVAGDAVDLRRILPSIDASIRSVGFGGS